MTYNGKRSYPYGTAGQAVYEVRGNLVYQHGGGGQATYEIRGNQV